MSEAYKYPLEFKAQKSRFNYFLTESKHEIQRLTCAKCNDILIEPYQTECGCRFCSGCLDKCVNICVGCGDLIKESFSLSPFHDKAAEKEIFQSQMKCINEPCTHECKLRDLIGHLDTCDFRGDKSIKIKCHDCGVLWLKNDFIERHRNINGNIDSLCDKWRRACPYNCCDEVQDNIKEHLGVCLSVSVDCPMKGVGCTIVLPRDSMNDHIRNDVQCHMMLIMMELVKLKNENKFMETEQLKKNFVLCKEYKELKNTVDMKGFEISNLKAKTLLVETNLETLLNEVNTFKQYQQCNEALNSKSPNAPSSSSSITSDGYFVWKVDNIVSKIKDAKRGINTQIFSDPFYTHTRGYKMCLKMYPAGDGKRAENHVSLYFVIMQGDYDEEVAWPFQKKISIRLSPNEPFTSSNLSAGQTIFVKQYLFTSPKNFSCDKPTNGYDELFGDGIFISCNKFGATDQSPVNQGLIVSVKISDCI